MDDGCGLTASPTDIRKFIQRRRRTGSRNGKKNAWWVALRASEAQPSAEETLFNAVLFRRRVAVTRIQSRSPVEYSSIPAQVQTGLRSPWTLSMRPAAGQNLWSFSHG